MSCRSVLTSIVLALAVCAPPVLAQYPEKPIRLIVPSPLGGNDAETANWSGAYYGLRRTRSQIEAP